MGTFFKFAFLVLLELLVFPVENGAQCNFPMPRPHKTDCSKFIVCDGGRIVERECAPGTLFNPGVFVCDWASNVDCGRAPIPVHGRWTDWSDWSSCSATCGSTATHRRQRNCSNPPPSDGGRDCRGPDKKEEFCQDHPPCPSVECEDLIAPVNGFINVGGRQEGAYAAYTCDDGYIMKGTTNVRSCLSGFIWSQTAPTCEPLDCGNPPKVEDSRANYTLTTFGEEARYVCDDGFSVYNGTENRFCGIDSNWNGTDIYCVLIVP